MFSITDQLNTPVFPVAMPRLSIVGIFTREAADPGIVDLQLRLQIGEQQLFNGAININFLQQLSARNITEMRGLVLPNPGLLTVSLSYQDRVLGVWSINLVQIGQPELQMFMAPPERHN